MSMLPGSISPSRWCSRCSIPFTNRGSKAITVNSALFAGARPASHSTQRGSGSMGNWKNRWDTRIGTKERLTKQSVLKLKFIERNYQPRVITALTFPFPVQDSSYKSALIYIPVHWKGNIPVQANCHLPEWGARCRNSNNFDCADFVTTSQRIVYRISDIYLQSRSLNSTKTDWFCLPSTNCHHWY